MGELYDPSFSEEERAIVIEYLVPEYNTPKIINDHQWYIIGLKNIACMRSKFASRKKQVVEHEVATKIANAIMP